jgi:general secretion pathway protein M
MINELKGRWGALPERTRQLASIGVVLITIVFAYSALWRPLQKDLTRLRTDVPRETQQLDWMRAQAPAAKAMRGKLAASTGPLVPTLEQSATSSGVRTFTKVEAEGNNGARITLEQVPFNSLLTWVSELQAGQGLTIEDATIEAQAAPGVVNAKLRLRTAP